MGTKGKGTRKRVANAQVVCQDCGTEFLAFRTDALRCVKCRYAKQREWVKANKDREREKFRRYEERNKQPCPKCGTPILRGSLLCRACSRRDRIGKRTREDNGWWKGGVHINRGYRYIRTRVGSGSGAYRPEHHLVWERTYGKPVPKGWVLHHLSGDKLDNRPENLVAMPRQEHHKHPRQALRPYEERIRRLETELPAATPRARKS